MSSTDVQVQDANTVSQEVLCALTKECTDQVGAKLQSFATSANRSNNQVSHRSIRIQLSRQSTPRLASRSLVSHSGGRTRRSTTASLTNSATGGEEEELEYDYYEYKHLGKEESSETGQTSGMVEEFEFVSHIDIDQIVRKETSGWLEGLANGEKFSTNGRKENDMTEQDYEGKLPEGVTNRIFVGGPCLHPEQVDPRVGQNGDLRAYFGQFGAIVNCLGSDANEIDEEETRRNPESEYPRAIDRECVHSK
ncbi:hypothetical protein DdX_20182 [Ditylenchus destructor]|uniref:Uncharacterized protein n=1 Tax=Ditylenchus destructor TaxID=166010 RepID=A0AAD4MGM4_9BILA|nr:hypothetical protein DdX_20182 [Ditylenchus destructor]